MSSFFDSGSIFGGSGTSILAQWASIRNGSYKKLMQAYYGKKTSSTNDSTSTKKKDTVEEKKLTEAEDSAQGLKDSADALMATGSKSVFKKVTSKDAEGNVVQDYDKNKIYNAVKKFVDNYNNTMESIKSATSSGVSNNRKSLIQETNAYADRLSELGISINADNTLSIDESTFKNADMAKAESLFNGRNSYGYQASLRASLIGYYAGREADTYNKNGGYNTYSSGMNFSDFF